jgi:predicted Rossmann-fold nucleotide-binding protein
VLVGKEFFGGLVDYIRKTLLEQGMIAADDVDIVTVTDDPEEVVRIMQEGSRRRAESTGERVSAM